MRRYKKNTFEGLPCVASMEIIDRILDTIIWKQRGNFYFYFLVIMIF